MLTIKAQLEQYGVAAVESDGKTLHLDGEEITVDRKIGCRLYFQWGGRHYMAAHLRSMDKGKYRVQLWHTPVPQMAGSNGHRLTDDEKTAVIADYKCGLKIAEICAKHNVSNNTVIRLTRHIKRPPRISQQHRLFPDTFTANTPEAAYWRGIVYTRGAVRAARPNMFVLSCLSKQFIEAFQAFVGAEAYPIYSSSAGYSLQLSAPRFIEWLQYGRHIYLRENTDETGNINFLRGLADGYRYWYPDDQFRPDTKQMHLPNVPVMRLFLDQQNIRYKTKNCSPRTRSYGLLVIYEQDTPRLLDLIY